MGSFVHRSDRLMIEKKAPSASAKTNGARGDNYNE
jgi:hypothetical protein